MEINNQKNNKHNEGFVRQKEETQRERKNRLKHEKRERNRHYVYEYLLEHPCVDCGEEDPVVLEFDHMEGFKKHNAISELVLKEYSIKTIQEEIDKCEVRCANCHRRKTAVQLDWWIIKQTGHHKSDTK